MRSPEKNISFNFNGEEIMAVEGQSIAAAVFARGNKKLRTTRLKGEDRSIFCGIGVCWDCVVTVNGVINQRACLVQVTQGMVVQS
jgi:aerobic-type carbon monoxide dehydrogenase small subunit (CoxS/CutS family)